MKIYFYPEYTEKSGEGHLKRLLALNEYLNKKFSTCFIFKTKVPKNFKTNFLKLPKEFNYKKDIDYIKNKMNKNSAIVLDGYVFDSNYQDEVKKKISSKLIFIDDNGGHNQFADIIVNHAPGVKSSDYKVNPKTKLLLGLDYLLIRKAFTKKTSQSQSNNSKSVFVCFGGCDTENLSQYITEELMKISKVEKINLVLGEQYSFSKEWAFNKKIKLLQNLDAEKMTFYMKKSSLIIVPSSTLVLESLCVGKPIIAIKTSKNQNFIFKGLDKYDHVYKFDYLGKSFKKNLIKNVLKILSLDNLKLMPISLDSKDNFIKVFQKI